MSFGDRFRTEVIPERVYSLCKLAGRGKFSKSELREYLQPSELNSAQDFFPPVYEFCERSDLIAEDAEGYVLLRMDPEHLHNIERFRKFMAGILLGDELSMFFRYTSWYLAQNERIFQYRFPRDLQAQLSRPFLSFMEVDLLAWRFWASFLGIGFRHQTRRQNVVIPNTAIRIQDCLEEQRLFPGGELIMFHGVMDWLLEQCPEFEEGIRENNLSLGVSSGLRTLHDQGHIELHLMRDAEHLWHLTRMGSHAINKDVSHVILRDGDSDE